MTLYPAAAQTVHISIDLGRYAFGRSPIIMDAFKLITLTAGLLSLFIVDIVDGSASGIRTCPATVTAGLGLGGDITRIVNAQTWQDCCAICGNTTQCASWTWKLNHTTSNTCSLRHTHGTGDNPHNKPNEKVSGVMSAKPTPPPTQRPTPSPVPAGTQKNIVFVINDDQDLVLGSMRAMPNAVRLLGDQGANLSQFRVNTPICCPSRATMLSGRYQHNNKVDKLPDGGCMHMNTSQQTNPDFWVNSHVKLLHDNHGYTTGLFGKTLNTWDTYGCDNVSGMPLGVDRQLVMCTHTFFDCLWVNDSTVVHTGNASKEYTTSVLGNESLAWIKSVLDKGKTHPPFYAWIGPHAPHLPSTPAPWYADHPIGLLTPPKDEPYFNYSALDHHPLVAVQDILNDDDVKSIDAEYSKRMRSLLSVDDLIVALHALLVEYDEWENTFVMFSSDHGYSLGQYRIPTHKMQVYENTLRVPFLVHGPGIVAGTDITALTQFADIGPTLMQIAGATSTPAIMDGRSFVSFLDTTVPASPRPWRTEHLATHQAIYYQHCVKNNSNGTISSTCGRHPITDATNTHRSIRIINSTHSLMYAEFTDVTLPAGWDFSPGSIQFYELYDMQADPYQLKNLYATADEALKQELAQRLNAAYHCSGVTCP